MLRLARYTKHGGERGGLPDLLEPGGARPRVFREERAGSNSTGTPVGRKLVTLYLASPGDKRERRNKMMSKTLMQKKKGGISDYIEK